MKQRGQRTDPYKVISIVFQRVWLNKNLMINESYQEKVTDNFLFVIVPNELNRTYTKKASS